MPNEEMEADLLTLSCLEEEVFSTPLNDEGPLCASFRARGCFDFGSALKWIRDRPYGKTHFSSTTSLFEEGQGTCTTKHALAAALSDELNLHWEKFIVFYRLDESIYRGAADVLRAHGLAFLPASHCIIGNGIRFLDLTHGNDTGKLKDLNDFDLFFRVNPMPSPKRMSQLLDLALSFYSEIEPKLANLPLQTLKHLRQQCVQSSRLENRS